jgi:hypothetical protein
MDFKLCHKFSNTVIQLLNLGHFALMVFNPIAWAIKLP